MFVIGLCGGSGSGKGSVCDIFRKYGVPSVDTDAVYRELTSRPSPCLSALEKEFGSEIITEYGALNRQRLSSLVFSGEGAEYRLKRLNEISHKFILDETRLKLEGYRKVGATAAIVDAPVLFESGFDSECDCLICVISDKEKRVERIISRDAITREKAEERIASQMSDDELISRCQFVISNNGDFESLDSEVKRVLQHLFCY